SPFIVATSNVVTPNAEKTNDGFQTVGKKKKRKGKSKSTNGGQITGNSSKKDNLSMSNSFSALNEEEEEDEEEVENVYDDSANLIHNKQKLVEVHLSRLLQTEERMDSLKHVLGCCDRGFALVLLLVRFWLWFAIV
ncbi:hypothetical protein Tco_0159444, partial [Tanacetum coccineum]